MFVPDILVVIVKWVKIKSACGQEEVVQLGNTSRRSDCDTNE